ncbi:MAG: hypothetical protein GEV05_12095 [Betaproteobacteria bacterium]|nr:hypothetical protein [Betaproteobacteria bacterium]
MNTRFGPSSAAHGHRLRPRLLPPELRLKSLVAATALALAMLPDASFGQSIGPLDVRSRLGERFFAAVPVRTPDGIIDPGCIRVAPNPNAPAGAQALQGARIRVGSADTVIIETLGTVMGPVVGLRLEVGCENPVGRDFVVLDPSVSQPAVPAAASAAATPLASTSVASTPAAPIAERLPRAVGARPQRRTRDAVPAASPAAQPKPVEAGAVAAAARAAITPPAPRAATATRSAAPAAAPAAAETSTAAPASAESQRRISELRARSDDHAAALLALEDRLALLQKQAELLKAQLEQRLAATPERPDATASAASSPTAAAAAPIASAPAAATSAAAPAPLAAPAASSLAAPAAAPATALGAAPAAQPKPASTAASSAPAAAPAASSTRGQSVLDLLLDWKVAGGIGVLLLGAFAISRRRRPTFKPTPATPASTAAPSAALFDETPLHQRTQEVPVLAQAVRAVDTAEWEVTQPRMVDQTAEWVAPPTTDSLPLPDAVRTQPVTLPGAAMTREYHITQQFQPAAERVVALSSPEEIVQQARTHYMEDDDVFKAIDLLEMAVSARKDSTRPWQALFAIYRRENMPERYQRLVLAYRGAFGQDNNWPAIRTLGQQMDPTNALYGDEAGGETIPDDLVERWLGVPLDFTAHLLANEMHDQLMDTYSGRKRSNRR